MTEKKNKEQSKEITITGEMAEKMFVLSDSIEYKGETLYDIIFQKENMQETLAALPKNKREQCKKDVEKLMKADGEEAEKLGLDMMSKYPEIYKPAKDISFKINKMLNLNASKAKEFAKIYDGKAHNDIFEAVEVCLKAIRFLKTGTVVSDNEII